MDDKTLGRVAAGCSRGWLQSRGDVSDVQGEVVTTLLEAARGADADLREIMPEV